ncbi:MAG: PLP-dependent transferase [Phycisphaerae bacterium]|jgi:cystathionine beta-lyase/cystathionine gamma-synthase|nr:PLP-dependent transferase [Phycisphaerae bacterium]
MSSIRPSTEIPLPSPPTSPSGSQAPLPRADGFATRAIHGWGEPDDLTGSILTPIVQAATYRQRVPGGPQAHTYSRASNPTVDALERCLGGLESAEPAVAFASGLAATHALALATLAAGDHAIVGATSYGGTLRLFRETLAPLGIRATFVDATELRAVAAAFEPRTRLVLVETPANPTLELCDIAAIARVATAARVRFAVDNTFLTPTFQRPLDLGADVTLTSTTKWIDGHNATIGGSLVTRDAEFRNRLAYLRTCVGSIQSPVQAWLTLQGVKTLPLRMERHSAVAQRIASRLEGHPALRSTRYPGLASFPQRALASRQHVGAIGEGHGGIIALDLAGGRAAAVRLARSLRIVTLAESLGSVESLLTHPATMTHASVPEGHRVACGIGPGLVRLSVGLESDVDLLDDLLRGLDGLASRSLVDEEEVARAN